MLAIPEGEIHLPPEVRLDYQLKQVGYPPLGGRRRAEVVLVVRRLSGGYMMMRKHSYARDACRLPTGGVKRTESVREALVRETYEEAGLEVGLERYLGELRYRRTGAEQPLFTRHAFLIAERSFGPTDEDEGIDGWQEVDDDGLLAQVSRPRTPLRVHRVDRRPLARRDTRR